jgi:osmotically-inducible protein OsmY
MEQILDRPDETLRGDVEAALLIVLGVRARRVGVAAHRGTITLSGPMPSEAVRRVAHAAVLGTPGVLSVADDVVVQDIPCESPTDADVARSAQSALGQAADIPRDAVRVDVRDHVVILQGTVTTASERIAAERAITYVRGVSRIDNHIRVRA